ncbi:hypothetical protein K7432_011677 [Basidiobolus ranarum]|uniref:Cytochrome P450 n=1 Tax=Basidiobolus ranarum TaxID=34480 RepID=A0ABR2WM15_9FUNG
MSLLILQLQNNSIHSSLASTTMTLLTISLCVFAPIVAISWYLYDKVKCPKALQNIPEVSLWKSIWAYINFLDASECFDKLVLPVITEKGVARQFVFGKWIVMVSNPEYAKFMLMKSDIFPKIILSREQPNTLQAKLLSVNIATVNGEEWRKHRRVANPAFHRTWTTSIFGELVFKLISEIDRSSTHVPVKELMQRMTLDALGKVIFDYDFNSIENQGGEMVRLYNTILTGISSSLYTVFPFLENAPLVGRRGYQTELNKFNEFIMGIINSKLEKIRDGKPVDTQSADLVTLMIQAGESEKERLTPEEIRNDVIIFFIAGHDTTANALSTAIYYLGLYPEYQQKAREEANRVLGDEAKNVCPTFEQQQNSLIFITAVIKESMRLNPSAAQIIPRRTTEPVQFGEFTLPIGTPTNIHIYAMHHNPNLWENPYRFMPERFLDETVNHDLFSWMPFGGGSRRCIGMNFSLIEQRIVLSMLVRKFSWMLPMNSVHFERLKTRPGLGLMETRNLTMNFKALY